MLSLCLIVCRWELGCRLGWRFCSSWYPVSVTIYVRRNELCSRDIAMNCTVYCVLYMHNTLLDPLNLHVFRDITKWGMNVGQLKMKKAIDDHYQSTNGVKVHILKPLSPASSVFFFLNFCFGFHPVKWFINTGLITHIQHGRESDQRSYRNPFEGVLIICK